MLLNFDSYEFERRVRLELVWNVVSFVQFELQKVSDNIFERNSMETQKPVII